MRNSTVAVLNSYYSGLLGVGTAGLWRTFTAQDHDGRLREFKGFYVVLRHEGAHASTPEGESAATLRAMTTDDGAGPREMTFWNDFATERRARVVATSKHSYLDQDPGPVVGVRDISKSDLGDLREVTAAAEWAESGWDDQPGRMFGAFREGRLVAAANLNLFEREPRDVGVLVHPDFRGRGLPSLSPSMPCL